ncbi:MAG TPA: ISNCY family transposase [Longimicrobiales bacterium]|nr:ISNCY family transposase [Longimicrobiales bacterium]
MLEMSQRDRDRLVVIRQVAEKRITVTRGAELLRLSRKQVGRIRDDYLVRGDVAVIHKARGRRPNNAKPEEWRGRVLERAAEQHFHDFRPTLLAEHLSRDPRIGEVNPHTLRYWLIEEGRWKVKRRGARHRKARPRRAALGELVQWDSSEHAWLEERYPGRLTLVTMIDDATSRVQYARFTARDNGVVNREAVIAYLRQHGRPLAFYADQAGHFVQWTRGGSDDPLEEREARQTESIIRRGLSELDVELITAYSPQAKGRVERGFGTAQDRLIKEMRVAGIRTLEEANRFLEEVWIPFWNQRFTVEPAETRDRHRPLSKRASLERLFAHSVTRVVNQDFTLRFRNRRYQIPREQAKGVRPKQKVAVEVHVDGSVHFWLSNRELRLEMVEHIPAVPVHEPRPRRARVRPQSPQNAQKPRQAPQRPAANHPWRNSRIGRRQTSTPAAARPALSSPRHE